MRLFRALGMNLATGLGYLGGPDDLRSRLIQINGVFRRSKGGDTNLILAMMVLALIGAVCVYGLVTSGRRYGYDTELWIATGVPQVLMATILGIVWRRFNT